jgi:proline-specific peptidase
VKASEGRIPFRGYETWYRIVGDGEPDRLPVLTLHGGPGAAHDYLEPVEALAGTGRRIIFYDQAGCGKSSRTPQEMWTIETFVEEVGVVREALDLERCHLLGSSWGGMLALEYVLRARPTGLASLVLCSSPASIPLWIAETARLRAELPEDIRKVLDEHEAAGTTESPEHQAAQLEFYRRHLCRIDPWHDGLLRTFALMEENPAIYEHMQGRNEFTVTGTLNDWDVSDRLGEIDLPTLVMSGRYDECTPAIAEAVHRGIRGSEWIVFEESSHMAFAEEPERFVSVLDEFLRRVESAPA